jgi:hypothetical protein
MFAKVFQKMLDSSIWLESDSTLRVWLTLLLSMDSDGFAAFASIENLSRRARVKPSLTAKAIEILESPDPNSATPDDEGRRIRREDGGWLVLNCKKYRDISRHGDLRASRNKSAQVVPTQRNSAQLGTPIELSTNGINKSVPDIETEKEIEKVPEPEFFSSQSCARYVTENLNLSGVQFHWIAKDAIEVAQKEMGLNAQAASEFIVEAWAEYEKTDGLKGKKSFLAESDFLPNAKWRKRGETKPTKLEQLRALRAADGQNGLKLEEQYGRSGSDASPRG